MPKKIKITEAGISDFFKSFFRAKADGKEKAWIGSLEDKSPELADIWKDFDELIAKNMADRKKMMQKYGGESQYLANYLKSINK
jgi:hypothetical protein